MFQIVEGEQISGVKYTAKEEGKASCLDLPPMFELLWGSLPFTLSLSTYFQSYNWLSERTRRSGDVDNFCKTSNFWHFGGAANRPWLTCSLLKTMWLHGWEGLVKQFQLEVLGALQAPITPCDPRCRLSTGKGREYVTLNVDTFDQEGTFENPQWRKVKQMLSTGKGREYVTNVDTFYQEGRLLPLSCPTIWTCFPPWVYLYNV